MTLNSTNIQYSFLLALPAIAGASVLKLKEFAHIQSQQEIVAVLAGCLAAAVVGWAVIAGLLAYLRTRTLYFFVWYRLLFGGAVLWWVLKG